MYRWNVTPLDLVRISICLSALRLEMRLLTKGSIQHGIYTSISQFACLPSARDAAFNQGEYTTWYIYISSLHFHYLYISICLSTFGYRCGCWPRRVCNKVYLSLYFNFLDCPSATDAAVNQGEYRTWYISFILYLIKSTEVFWETWDWPGTDLRLT